MANNDEQIGKFLQAITEYAQEQREKILKEVEDFKHEHLQQAEQEALRDTYHLIQKERLALQNKTRLEMSRRELEARKKLLEKRRDMMNALFEEASQRLAAYTETPAYEQTLSDSLRQMQEQLPSRGTVYYIAVRDENRIPALTAFVPEGSRVETSRDIRLGGVRGVNMEVGLRLDDTLDARLEQQREWFTRHSGLTVE